MRSVALDPEDAAEQDVHEFNPEKQVNCPARAFAEFKSLNARSELEKAAADFDYFASRLPPI
ncbi:MULTISPECIES: DarT1-associated NADAR antitoxin family protein [Bosea]|jgi:hypothetical protein|uniref:Uncharacterized protein n=2 Tax=Bosea TaxID=85413 RepID=A0A0N1N4H3_9HYPH|nr:MULTISPECIES: hypothetical protein [Hyphomicrobiales]KPH82586.1 hypothetical protein AE618_02825 [Bosea vaviloviae]